MLHQSILIVITLALTPVGLSARLQDDHSHQAVNAPQKSLRVLIEDGSSSVPQVVEQLRRTARDYGLEIIFAAAAADAYDVRVLYTAGSGWRSNPDPNPTFQTVSYAYASAAALTPEGKLLFTASGSDSTAAGARIAVVKDLLKKLHLHYVALKQKQQRGDTGAASEQNQVANQTLSGLSDQPGVYYKSPAGWTQADVAHPGGIKTRGAGKALFSFGLASIKHAVVYRGTQAALQITERKPSFYIRGFAVSERNARIVRLEKRDNDRELHLGSISLREVRPRYRELDDVYRGDVYRGDVYRGDVYRVEVSRTAGDVSIIKPMRDLEPGEYLLLLDATDSGHPYDFGIKPGTQ